MNMKDLVGGAHPTSSQQPATNNCRKMTDVTRILNAIEQGQEKAADRLLPLVYEELRSLAARKLARESSGQTLQATALVHEAYLRLLGAENYHWDGQGHFFAAAAEAMRRILVERARQKKAGKRGGDHHRIGMEQDMLVDEQKDPADHLLALDEALEKLGTRDPVKADLVKLRYFAGLTKHQAAKALGISPATADRQWRYARAWLRMEILKKNA